MLCVTEGPAPYWPDWLWPPECEGGAVIVFVRAVIAARHPWRCRKQVVAVRCVSDITHPWFVGNRLLLLGVSVILPTHGLLGASLICLQMLLVFDVCT